MESMKYLKWLIDWSTASSNSIGPGMSRVARSWAAMLTFFSGVTNMLENEDFEAKLDVDEFDVFRRGDW
jgi:hypothetical protein